MDTRRFEPPMVIDMHAHLHEPGTTKWADQQGFDRTVIMTNPGQNDESMAFCKKSGWRFIPFCRLNMEDISKACDEVREFAEKGFRGVKVQPMTDRFLPDEQRMYPLWETIEELELPITAHAGCVKFPEHCVNFADPSGWSQVAVDFPKLTIVIAHLGGNYTYEALTIAESCENVYLDTAHLHYFCARMLPRVQPIELVERAVKYAGAKKVLFASEGMTPQYILDSLDISMEDRKYIFWKNALRVLGEPDV